MQLDTRRVGRTSLEVTCLGLGGATLGGNMEHVHRLQRPHDRHRRL